MQLDSKNNYNSGVIVSPYSPNLSIDYSMYVNIGLDFSVKGIDGDYKYALSDRHLLGFLNVFVGFKMRSIIIKHCRV